MKLGIKILFGYMFYKTFLEKKVADKVAANVVDRTIPNDLKARA